MKINFVSKNITYNVITFLVLYVNNTILIRNGVGMLFSMKAWLTKNFSIKDLEKLTYILILCIYRDRSRRLLGLSQSMYTDDNIQFYS